MRAPPSLSRGVSPARSVMPERFRRGFAPSAPGSVTGSLPRGLGDYVPDPTAEPANVRGRYRDSTGSSGLVSPGAGTDSSGTSGNGSVGTSSRENGVVPFISATSPRSLFATA